MMLMRKSILLGLTALAAAAALLLSAAGCSKGEAGNASKHKTNRTEDGVYFDSGETFCRGVWAADDGEKLLGYYIFYDSGNGRFDEIQMGMGVPFTVKAKKNNAEFSLGAADFTEPVTVEHNGKGKRILTWTNDNRVENITLIGEQEPDSFRFYSQKDLEEMALDYYEANNGTRPNSAEVDTRADGTASIHLYGKKGSEMAEYVVDIITGKGTVTGTDEEIQLIRMTTDD